MKMRWLAMIAALSGSILTGFAAAPVQTAEPPRKVLAADSAKAARIRMYQGILRSIDLGKRTVQVRVWFAHRTFEVPATCAMQARTNTNARLEDLKRGDDVDITYEHQGGQWTASRIAIRGVTRTDRQQAREKEQLQQILTPTPSERGID